MPLRLPDGLPAIDILKRENINIEDMLAKEDDKRPLRIVILNLMPFKATTELISYVFFLIVRYCWISAF